LIDNGFADAGTVRRPGAHRSRERGEHAFRNPVAEDAGAVFALIASCPPLDPNSLYCNLLQCTHFAQTCLIAERAGTIEGWISGYRPPDDAGAMFVWQVAVHENARGAGLGLAMLETLFRQPAIADADRLITTVTPSNLASLRMFGAFARQRGAAMEVRPLFDRNRHFGGDHESEDLIAIGPLQAVTTKSN
jgi:L-2,4-diaminobutyric acid acetyltransferase